jgi:hypothetical protein
MHDTECPPQFGLRVQNQINSLACVGIQGPVIGWTRQYLQMPADPPNRAPTPGCF